MAAHLPLVALGRGPAGADIEANLGVLDRAGGLVARAGRSSATSASRPLEHAKEGHFLEEIGMKLWTLKGSQPQGAGGNGAATCGITGGATADWAEALEVRPLGLLAD